MLPPPSHGSRAFITTHKHTILSTPPPHHMHLFQDRHQHTHTHTCPCMPMHTRTYCTHTHTHTMWITIASHHREQHSPTQGPSSSPGLRRSASCTHQQPPLCLQRLERERCIPCKHPGPALPAPGFPAAMSAAAAAAAAGLSAKAWWPQKVLGNALWLLKCRDSRLLQARHKCSTPNEHTKKRKGQKERGQ